MYSQSRVVDITVRYLILFFGLALMSLGIAFSIRSDLGTSPISSVPYVLSVLTPLTVGTFQILINMVFLALQILILRRRFPPVQFLQIPVVFIFGILNDAALWAVGGLTYSAYWQQWILAGIGILLVGIGVAFQIKAKATPLAGEGLILTISNELIRRYGPKKSRVFGAVKVKFDSTLVLIALALAVIFTHSLVGVREGTILAALLVGTVAQFTTRLIEPATTVENASVRTTDETDPV